MPETVPDENPSTLSDIADRERVVLNAPLPAAPIPGEPLPHWARLTRRMLVRRIRWWAWVYLWVAVGLIVLSTAIVSLGTLSFLREGRDLTSSLVLNDFLICRGFEWLLGIWVFIVGCCIASFLNVVAYRLPAGLPVTGHSFCPHCKVAIEKRDNVPILGWLNLQGRCRSCKIRISPRYPVFEAIGGLLLLSIFLTTILSHGANLPSVHQQVMPYGLPVNLRLIDPVVFAFAFLHGWLLLLLFTAALTHFGHGRLPIWVWILGIAVSLTTIALNPELVVLPIARPTDGVHVHNTDFDYEGHRLISPSIAAMSVSIGLLVGVLVGYTSQPQHRGSSIEATAVLSRSMWIGSCSMIGCVLGYEAVIGIVVLNVILRFAIHSACSFATTANIPNLSLQKLLAFGPLATLWFSTTFWLAAWIYLHRTLVFLAKNMALLAERH